MQTRRLRSLLQLNEAALPFLHRAGFCPSITRGRSVFTVSWQDDEGEHRQRLTSGLCKVGRSPGNDIVIRNRSVSRRHAVLFQAGDVWHIKDVGSQNGTRLNGRFVREGVLEGDDEIYLGDVPLTLVPSAQSSSVMVSPPSPSHALPALAEPLEGSIILSADEVSSGEIRQSGDTIAKEADFPAMLAALAKVAQEMMQLTSLDELLDRIIDLVFQYAPVENAFLLLYEDRLGELVPRVVRGREGGEPEGTVSTHIVQRVFHTRECILTLDAQEDPRFAEGMSIVTQGIRSVMCVPLWVRDHTCGVLFADSTRRAVHLLQHHLHFMSLLANVAAAAIQRVQLQRRLQQEATLKERLMRYQSPTLVDKLLADDPKNGMLEPTEREVSVLFADMVGFSTLTESMRPREVALLLNRFFSSVVEVIFEYDGTLDKFIGDAVMAIFGAPHDQPDHASRAVSAAADIKQRLGSFNREFGVSAPVDVRIGINSGVAVSGDIGSSRRMEYTVLGNTVNIASRLEAFVAKPGDIVLGEATYQALHDTIEAESLGPQELKGIKQRVQAYRLIL